MSTQQPRSRSDASSPYRRDNWWGESDAKSDDQRGHVETEGTDPADYLAFQHLSTFTDLICGRTLRESDEEQPLTDPAIYLPKEHQLTIGYDEPARECPACATDDDRDGAALSRIAPSK